MVDLVDLALNGIVTFAAVFVAYFLAIRQDKTKESREDSELKKGLTTLFKHELAEMRQHLETSQDDAQSPVYFDVWDSAKASGRLALLTSKEFSTLSDIYISVRALNDLIQDFRSRTATTNLGGLPSLDQIGPTITVAGLKVKIFSEKHDVTAKIKSAQETLGWLAPTSR